VNDKRIGFHPQDNYYVQQVEGFSLDIGKRRYFLGELQPVFNKKGRLEHSKMK